MLVLFASVAALLLLLGWMARNPRRKISGCSGDPASLEETGRRHATYLPVIRQAMAPSDFEFLASCAPNVLARRAHREPQRIAMLYLADLRADFENLLRLARVVAALSPEGGASHEFERFALSLRFSCRYPLLILALYSCSLFLPHVH